MDLGDFNPVRVLAGKGEIGKTGLGPALATLALNYFVPGLGAAAGLGMSNAATAATLIGGGTALASGSLKKGLLAGMSAYGTTEVAGAAESGIADATTQRALDVQSNLAEVGNNYGDINDVNPLTSLTAGEKFSAGLKGLKAMPIMDLLKYGAMASAPVLTAQSQQGMPSNATNPGAYIRPKTYDPVSHRYYDLPAIKAGDFGSQSISDYVNSQVAPARAARGGLMAAYADGGMTQNNSGLGMFNYAQMQPAVDLNPNSGVSPRNMAKGGIAHFDAGGFTNQQISDYVSNIQAQGGGDKEIAAAMNQFHVDPGQVAGALGMNVGDVQSRYNTAIPTGGYATGTSGVSNNAINQYLGANPTASDATIYNAMQQYGVTPQQMAAATGNPLAGQGSIQDRYNLATDITRQGNIFGQYQGPGTPMQNLGSTYDQNWVAYMDAHKEATGNVDPITVQEMARTTGLSTAEVLARYNAAKAKLQLPIVNLPIDPKLVTKLNATAPTPGTANVTSTLLPTNSGTNAPAGTTNPFGNVNNPGDITRNPDGTVTVTSNTPGRPYGGFSGMDEVTNAFTAGGGRLGQVLKPTRTYTNSGGSGSAFDYLNNMGTWASTRTQPAAKVKNTYSNFSAPSADEIKQFSKYAKVYKDGVPVDNPYYNKDASSSTTKSSTASTDSNDAGGGLAGGGLSALAHGGMSDGHLGGYSDGGRLLRGPGDGVSDSIPATIAGKQPARLADGEFVVPARIVSEIGNGSTEAGARKLYAMMDRVQSARSKTVGKGRVAKNTRADKYLPA
jgi:hypothetical protein